MLQRNGANFPFVSFYCFDRAVEKPTAEKSGTGPWKLPGWRRGERSSTGSSGVFACVVLHLLHAEFLFTGT